MSTITIDVDAVALSELLSQFDDAQRLQDLLVSLVDPIQSLENDACYLIEDALMSNATDAYLDRYGAVVGIPRDGRPDDEYRSLILTRIQSNLTSGTIESIIQVVSLLAGFVQVIYSPLPPACFQLQVMTAAPLATGQIEDIHSAMLELTPAGVCWSVTEAPPGSFTYDKGPGFDLGKYARLISQGP